ncbi:hypothetical protein [uncultured Vibrio sp.]|uniref:hypothetical protein n=1 Tax=uncultured Vibrio sp. TaxID=114054 RepID=UPI00263024F3|nr:hypothetical protein [uncultured Vibrio sp.]
MAKKGYFDLRDAWDEVKSSSSVKETALTSSKLVGKLSWNTVRSLPSIAISLANHNSEQIINNPKATEAQKQSARKLQSDLRKYK